MPPEPQPPPSPPRSNPQGNAPHEGEPVADEPTPINLAGIGAGEPPPPQVHPDHTAKQEGKELFGDPKRHEELKQAIHEGVILVLQVAFIAMVVVLLIRVLHFVLPENNASNAGGWRPHGWLTDPQLASIDKFLFSGTLGALVSRYLGSVFAKPKSQL